MINIKKKLTIDPEQVCQDICVLLRDKLEAMEKDGILIGLSGGLDSAVVAFLARRSVNAEKLTLLNMPDRDSKKIHRQHARLVCEELGVPLQVQNLS